MSTFFYMGEGMAFEEKRAWIMAVVTLGTYAVYLTVVLSRADHTPLAEVSYVSTLVWTVVAAIAASIVLEVAVSLTAKGNARRKDQRDKEIGRFGEYVGHSFVVIGGLAAMGMAMAETPPFWIANAIYLAFALSAVLGSVAKIFAYRRGFPW
ncbi:hypothetical protein [Streptomyces sp. NPDC059176]|uniref:hypothetical protein n=1 Tax=unclassified Streptomyces TaxID=2593676 RepID=UPI00369E6156